MKLEERIQFEIVMWLQSMGYYFYSIPNEATAKRASHFIAMGMRKGASDLVIVLPKGRSLYVEVKREDGVQRRDQILFEKRLKELDHEYILVRSVEAVQSALALKSPG